MTTAWIEKMGSTEYRDPGSWPNVHTGTLVTCPFTVVSNRQKAKPVSNAVTTNGRLLGWVTRIAPTTATRTTATIAVAPFFPANDCSHHARCQPGAGSTTSWA